MANGSEAGRFSQFIARDRLGALMRSRFISVTPEQCLYEYEASAECISKRPVDPSTSRFLHASPGLISLPRGVMSCGRADKMASEV